MITYSQRLRSLINLIGMKQKAYKAKQLTLKGIVDNKEQIRRAKRTRFQFQSIRQLFKALLTINISELSAMLVLSTISLVMQLFSANFNTFLITQFQHQSSNSNLLLCIFILILYKLTKALVDQSSSYLQMNYGFLGYSALYFSFLNSKQQITGEVLNIIEDDMQKIANLPYSLINFPYLSIVIIVLTALIVSTLESNTIAFAGLSFLLYALNTIGGVLTFYLNQKVMKQKDYRLGLNLTEYQNPSTIEQARKKQVSLIRNFLLVKVIIKWFIEVFFVLFYALIFLWTDDHSDSQDQLYHRLTLIGMLKIAFNGLYIESYFIALVLNSLKRMIICQNRQEIQKSTIGCYEDFMKKNKKTNSQTSPQTQRESIESSTNSQNLMSESLLQSQLRISQQDRSSVQIKPLKQVPLTQRKSRVIKKKYIEKGQIKLIELIKYIGGNINWILIFGLLIFGLATLYTKFQYLKISKSIIHNNLSSFETFIFVLPAFLYLGFYMTIILLFGQVSQNLFKNLNPQQIQGQDLNRISGDIQLVDKYVPPTFYEFFITVFSLLSSLILTVSLIKDLYYAISTAVLLLVIILLAVYYNRYFMKSRREIKRLECRMKSKIIQTYADHISSHSEGQISFDKVEKSWKKINILKNAGIIIQNSYILLLNILVLIIQIACLIICYSSAMDSPTSKLILVFILQLDLSLTGLLLNTINLEMGLVNFQRCLNFVKKKKNQINKEKDNLQ